MNQKQYVELMKAMYIETSERGDVISRETFEELCELKLVRKIELKGCTSIKISEPYFMTRNENEDLVIGIPIWEVFSDED